MAAALGEGGNKDGSQSRASSGTPAAQSSSKPTATPMPSVGQAARKGNWEITLEHTCVDSGCRGMTEGTGVTDPATLTAWATMGLAGATLVIAVVAVFQDWIRGLIWKANLEILPIKVVPPDCHKIPVGHTLIHWHENVRYEDRREADSYYFRIRIKNKGNVPAKLVEVFAESLTRRRQDGTFETVSSFLPMNLVWAHINQVYYPLIPAKTSRLCAFGHIVDPDKRSEFPEETNPRLEVQDGEAIFSLDLMTKPNSYSHLIRKGVYRLTLSVAAENSEHISRVVELNFPGTWEQDEDSMLANGIDIKLVQKP